MVGRVEKYHPTLLIMVAPYDVSNDVLPPIERMMYFSCCCSIYYHWSESNSYGG
jgi:hypothetical protein